VEYQRRLAAAQAYEKRQHGHTGALALALPVAQAMRHIGPVGATVAAGVEGLDKLTRQTGGGVLGTLGAASRDAADFPFGMVKATGVLGKALLEGLQAQALDPLGKHSHSTGGGILDALTPTQRKLAEGFLHGSLAEAVQGAATAPFDGKASRAHFEAARKAFAEHPLYSIMDVAGAYGAVGRGAGAVMRTGALGKGARLAAGTAREDAMLVPGTGMVETQRYSKNVLTKAGQVRLERRAQAKNIAEGRHPNQVRPNKGRDAISSSLPSGFVKPGLAGRIRGHGDHVSAEAQAVRVRNRNVLERQLARASRGLTEADVGKVRGRTTSRARRVDPVERKVATKHRDLLFAAVESRINRGTLVHDLAREKARLETALRDHSETMSPDQRHYNAQEVAALDKALSDPQFLDHPEQFFRVADELRGGQQGRTERLIELKALVREQATAAAERPGAIARGAVYDGQKGPHPAAVERHERAKEAHGRARRAVRRAEDVHTRAVAKAGAARERANAARADLAKLLKEKGGHKVALEHIAIEGRIRNLRAQRAEAHGAEREALGKQITTAMAERRALRTRDAAAGEDAGRITALAQREQRMVNSARQAELKAEQRHREWREAQKEAKAHAKDVRATRPKDHTIGLKSGPNRSVGSDVPTAVPANQAAAQFLADVELAKAAVARGEVPGPLRGADGRVLKEGERLTTADVVATREQAGIPAPAFLSHAPSARGRSAHYKGWFGRRQGVGRFTRTGESTAVGGVDTSFAGLRDAMMNDQGRIDAIGAWDRLIHHAGGIDPMTGRPFTAANGEAFVNEWNARPDLRTGEHLVLTRAAPASYAAERQQAILADQAPGTLEQMRDLAKARYDAALAVPTDLERASNDEAFVVMPVTLAKRFQEQELASSLAALKAVGKITATFRRTVLPFSPKWLVGNVVEASLRSGIVAVIPWRDQYLTGKLFDEIEKVHGKEARDTFEQATSGGGLLYGKRKDTHTDSTDLAGTGYEEFVADTAGRAHAIGDTKVGKVLGAPFRGIGHAQRVSFHLNSQAETWFQQGVIGKLVRDEVADASGKLNLAFRSQHEAITDLVEGGLGKDPHRTVDFANRMDEILGKYTRWSPTTRRILNNIAPFLPWYLNAVRFVYHTLPVGHPVLTSLITNAERAYSIDWQDQVKALGRYGHGALGAAIRLSDGGLLDLARFTPAGAFTGMGEEGLIGVVTDTVFPQFGSIYKIGATGTNFAGRKLQIQGAKSGEDVKGGTRTWLALYAAVESLVPLVQMGRRMQEHGESPYDNSTIFRPKTKPNTAYNGPNGKTDPGVKAAALRVFSPLHPTYLKAPGGTVTSASPAARKQRTSSDPIQQAREAASSQPSYLQDPAIQEALRSLNPAP
jgi:hypothetical protein